MLSNFEFLKNDWGLLANFGETAETLIYDDLNTAVIKIRQLGEYIASYIINVEGLNEPQSNSQLDRIKTLKREGLIDYEIEDIFHIIRKKGNKAAHPTYIGIQSDVFKGSREDANKMLSLALKLSAWFKEIYGSDISFSAELVNYHEPIKEDYRVKYLALQKAYEEQEKAFINKSKLHTSEDEKAARRERRRNARMQLTEDETRELIDYQIRVAGWHVDTESINFRYRGTLPEKNKNMAIAEYPCFKEDGSNGWVDYALFIGKELVGVIEAKRFDKDISSALRKDARMYSKGAQLVDNAKYLNLSLKNEYKVPFMYSANGRGYNQTLPEKSGIWFYNALNSMDVEKAVNAFHSPRDIMELIDNDRKEAVRRLENDDIDVLKLSSGLSLRDYQVDAIKAVEESLVTGQNDILVTMATGTGKTRTALGLIYRLLNSKMHKRILFLVDRRTLGEQTLDTFNDVKIRSMKSFGEIFEIKGLGDREINDDTKFHVATVQSMVKRIFYNDVERPSIGQYDCIIIDEAHRGYILDKSASEEELEYRTQDEFLSKYRRVLNYFEADKIALTATPAKHTAEIFGAPVYTYTYRQAVLDGYLVDHEPPYIFGTKLMDDGITYEIGDIVQVYDTTTQTMSDYTVDDELNFEVEQFNRKVVNESFIQVMCEELTNHLDPFGEEKTLIFAVNNNHADMIVRILTEEFEKVYDDFNKELVAKITGEIKDASSEVKKFKLEQVPNIVVTVDLLTTGVDIPEVGNLVFMRKVKSRILYEQMIGRATRKCDKINKDHFKIFDCVNLYDDLKEYTDMKAVVKQPNVNFKELASRLLDSGENFEEIRDQLIAKMQRKAVKLKKNPRSLSFFEQEAGMPFDEFINIIKNTTNVDDFVEHVGSVEYLDELKLGGTRFIVSEEQDVYTATKRLYNNKFEDPSDYLDEFNKWVKTAEFDVLKLMRENPEKLSGKEYKQIKTVLDMNGFGEQELKSAYQDMTNTNITTNLLTFIKHAIQGAPMIDFEDKVDDVMKKVKKLNRWNQKQISLLETIEKQLKANHIVTINEINSGLLKQRYGGEQRIDKLLDHKLNEILNLIKDEIILH